MSQVATTPLDLPSFKAAGELVAGLARAGSEVRAPWSPDDVETAEFAEYWFAEAQRNELARLSAAINDIDEIPIRRALQIALSRLIITKSPKASLASDTAHSRPHRTTQVSNFETVKGFESSITQLIRVLGTRELHGQVEVALGDARGLTSVEGGSIDWMFTSPPYLNAIDYLRGHKLSLIWLGYSIAELRRIRSISIGAERAPDDAISERAQKLLDGVKRRAKDPETLPMGTLGRYAADLVRFADEMDRVLAKDARAVVVVGNSSLRGNDIRNDFLVGKALLGSGLRTVRRDTRPIPENRRYMPSPGITSGTAMSKRMRTEVIMSVRRA